MLETLADKAANMSAEGWGDFAGQVLFEVGTEVATAGGAAALTAVKAADKVVDVAKIANKADDFVDVAKALDKLDDAADIAKAADKLDDAADAAKALDKAMVPKLEPPIKSEKRLGGAHKDLDFDSSIATGKKRETIEQHHHMPCQAAGNKGGNGGAITMETSDHKKTASWDNISGAKMYQERQRTLIEQGKFREAFEMDIQDIREKFGDKYDEAIKQLEEWYK
ncbi:Uncharacterised protein [Porphyromonas crevioricanis]|uniref:Uncharacterized protein n=1 Tax=Porphyromonas crevioricanis TaxID=393921 RepID=A0A2X4PPG7_9PORP|nr:hypothetical protein [Porphyromonas crevioricanis]GAD08309.1 hypothetical protein; putative phosphoglycerate kinase [Porphyromonas crevioricanis JCM 13913]SQH73763.1 Uncharacterised protein [Porphyromonas crevioricanis]